MSKGGAMCTRCVPCKNAAVHVALPVVQSLRRNRRQLLSIASPLHATDHSMHVACASVRHADAIPETRNTVLKSNFSGCVLNATTAS